MRYAEVMVKLVMFEAPSGVLTVIVFVPQLWVLTVKIAENVPFSVERVVVMV